MCPIMYLTDIFYFLTTTLLRNNNSDHSILYSLLTYRWKRGLNMGLLHVYNTYITFLQQPQVSGLLEYFVTTIGRFLPGLLRVVVTKKSFLNMQFVTDLHAFHSPIIYTRRCTAHIVHNLNVMVPYGDEIGIRKPVRDYRYSKLFNI